MCRTAMIGIAPQWWRAGRRWLIRSDPGALRSEITLRASSRRCHNARVLELGSGPGFLAHRVLDRCPSIEGYTLLDFSEHMLGLSRERLVAFPAATFVLGSFKSEDWTRHVEGRFDCVLAMQSVHELHGTSGTQHDCTNRSTKFSPFLDSSRSVTTFPSTTRRRARHST